MNMLISSNVVITSQCICISNHQIVHLKYIQFLIVKYISKKKKHQNKTNVLLKTTQVNNKSKENRKNILSSITMKTQQQNGSCWWRHGSPESLCAGFFFNSKGSTEEAYG